MNIFTKVPGLAQQTRYVESVVQHLGSYSQTPLLRGFEVGGPVAPHPTSRSFACSALCDASKTSFPKTPVMMAVGDMHMRIYVHSGFHSKD